MSGKVNDVLTMAEREILVRYDYDSRVVRMTDDQIADECLRLDTSAPYRTYRCIDRTQLKAIGITYGIRERYL